MPFRKSTYLKCFYCGLRTSTRYNTTIHEFDCPSCESTNYLDENGEITDPPAAAAAANDFPTTSSSFSASQKFYARSLSPELGNNNNGGSGSSTSVFCNTCVKNQHLFTASLAQYFPDDEDDPEYKQRENEYYAFRRNLEKRYPQMCTECEPRVLGRLSEAGYTAKSDHLRRMLRRSHDDKHKKGVRWTRLDYADFTGRVLWGAGWILQILWHISVFRHVIYRDQEEELLEQPRSAQVRRQIAMVLATLPLPTVLLRLSVYASVLSSPWNPRFVQSIRGFTNHITGLRTWYSLQVMILALKLGAYWATGLNGVQQADMRAQIGGHVFAALFTTYIYRQALRTVRTDNTRLFTPTSSHTSFTPQLKSRSKSARNTPNQRTTETLADVLDDVLKQPTTHLPFSNVNDDNGLHERVSKRHGYRADGSIALAGNPFEQYPFTVPNTIGASQQPRSEFAYDDRMDIDVPSPEPPRSKYRAFESMNTAGGGGSDGPVGAFGSTPVDPNRGPIWYKIPPAPTTPAARMRNPFLRAGLTTKGQAKADRPAVRFGDAGARSFDAVDGGAMARSKTEVEFAQPRFFAPSSSDSRSHTTDALADAFSEL